MDSLVIQNVRPFVNGRFDGLCSMALVNGNWVAEAPQDAPVFDANGALAIPALFALGVDFQEPMRDDVYTFEKGFKAMHLGGFYGALYESSANPIDDIQRLSALKQAFSASPLEMKILASFSKNYKCSQLSEMLELSQYGVVGFGDGNLLNATTRFLRLSMEYGSMTGNRFFFLPLDLSLRCAGSVHEGAVSDMLGMKGIPRIAETIVVHTILETALFLGQSVHLKQITCAESLKLIESARQRGLDVTCDVSLYHLLFDDENLLDLHSHFYLIPPLRSKADKEALWNGIKNGLIDAISCNHKPVLTQEKQVNFEDATPGALSLEVALPAIWKPLVSAVGESRAIELLSMNPAKIALATPQKLSLGSPANLVILHPEKKTLVQASHFAGAVQNSPLLGAELPAAIEASYLYGAWTQV